MFISGGNIEVIYTAQSNVLAQNIGRNTIKFQTDNTSDTWGNLCSDKILEIPSGTTVYFKAEYDSEIAIIQV